MRYCLSILVLAALSVAGTGCEQIKTRQKPQTNTDIKTDNKPLLLLDEEEDFVSPGGTIADNSRCHVCHMNYIKEDIAVIHARANIGCANCHGDCDAHIADESWASGGNGTPPGIMYPREKINPFCMGCHNKAKIDTEQHEPLFADSGEKKYCTDCHGNHRLTNRKCKWK
jgi:hypothetical protein